MTRRVLLVTTLLALALSAPQASAESNAARAAKRLALKGPVVGMRVEGARVDVLRDLEIRGTGGKRSLSVTPKLLCAPACRRLSARRFKTRWRGGTFLFRHLDLIFMRSTNIEVRLQLKSGQVVFRKARIRARRLVHWGAAGCLTAAGQRVRCSAPAPAGGGQDRTVLPRGTDVVNLPGPAGKAEPLPPNGGSGRPESPSDEKDPRTDDGKGAPVLPPLPAVPLTSGGPAALTASSTATFNFGSSGAARYECSLDGGPFTTCQSPIVYSGLGDGSHSFRVRGVNGAGAGPATSQHVWHIDATHPETTIFDGPPPVVDDVRTATFNFAASEPGTTFECRLDDGAWTSCSAPWSVDVSAGSHAVHVRAADALGNVDATPSSWSWRRRIGHIAYNCGSFATPATLEWYPAGSPRRLQEISVPAGTVNGGGLYLVAPEDDKDHRVQVSIQQGGVTLASTMFNILGEQGVHFQFPTPANVKSGSPVYLVIDPIGSVGVNRHAENGCILGNLYGYPP